MADNKYNWHKVADHVNEIDFGENNIAVVEAGSKKICITLFNNNIFAFAYKCPHAGGMLADGYIDAIGNVVCPLHRYKYSLENGRNISGEGFFLKRFPVEIKDDGIYIGIEKGGLFGWFK